jgi:hypothetical protein
VASGRAAFAKKKNGKKDKKRRLIILKKTQVRAGPDITTRKKGTLKPNEVVTVLEELELKGHQRVRIGNKLWISRTIDEEGKNEKDIFAEKINEAAFFERIKKVDNIGECDNHRSIPATHVASHLTNTTVVITCSQMEWLRRPGC